MLRSLLNMILEKANLVYSIVMPNRNLSSSSSSLLSNDSNYKKQLQEIHKNLAQTR